jgi:cation diffusion facilitator CzcD-associated flavoprotein CzcO
LNSVTSSALGPDVAPASGTASKEIVQHWIDGLGQLSTQTDQAVDALWLADGWWRDFLALTWDIRTFHGRAEIKKALSEHLETAELGGFTLTPGKEPELVTNDDATPWIQAFLDFETAASRGRAVVRLVEDGNGEWRAWTFLTAMQELNGYEERVGHHRPRGTVHQPTVGRVTWREERDREREFVDGDPQALVVGAGQAGLTVAARLSRMGVSTLVVERNERVGDNWRNRYPSLVLHDPVWYDHLPYIPFPSSWPIFTPKDKLADWFEFYAESLDLNVWTGSDLSQVSYDDESETWSVLVRRAEGVERTLRVKHVIMATGANGQPSLPAIEGIEEFDGPIYHSSAHPAGQSIEGKKVVILGASTSAHDVAQDCYELGAAEVTMVQRSSTLVMSAEHGLQVLFEGIYEQDGPPTDDADLLNMAFPFRLAAKIQAAATREIAERDQELLDSLRKAGFSLDDSDDGSILWKYLDRAGGYYVDVGCSALIASGEIRLKQGIGVRRLSKSGVEFDDGTVIEADVIVMATGYQNMREDVRAIFGDDVADRCKSVWGLDEEGELRSVWRDSGHPHFWIMAGNLSLCRIFSRYLALRIKAIEEGLVAA